MEDLFGNLDKTLMIVEEHLSLLQTKSMEELSVKMSPIEKAKFNVAVAYAINALVFVLQKVQGVSVKDIRHTQIKSDLDRVRSYISRIKNVEELGKGRSLKVDAEAAKRFIDSALSSDQVYVDALSKSKNEKTSNPSCTKPSDETQQGAVSPSNEQVSKTRQSKRTPQSSGEGQQKKKARKGPSKKR